MQTLAGKRVTVAGLGRFGGGINVSKWLVEQGARVLVTDMAKPEALQSAVKELDGLPIEMILGEHREKDFQEADLIVASPAVPPHSRFLESARSKGVPITTEIRLFIERCPCRIVGVTGTKGKSTTTALLGRMLKTRYTTHVGGNIGGSLLFELSNINTHDLVVLELSSFMLEYLAEANWSPQVALVTMIAPDHIDRHGTMEAYVDTKMNIVRFQGVNDIAVLCEDCPMRGQFTRAAGGRVILYGLKDRKPFNLRIPGRHNQLNAQGAFAAANCLDVNWEEAQAAIRDFTGLPHRLELVHEERGVRYFNDSIATIPQAAVAALEAFAPKTVLQIVGGYDKKIPLTAMFGPLVERAKAVLCIGATGASIAEALSQASRIGAAQVFDCHDLTTAIKIAKQSASPGDVVLLSTGCASYDQFENFEKRGEAFAALARGEEVT